MRNNNNQQNQGSSLWNTVPNMFWGALNLVTDFFNTMISVKEMKLKINFF